VDIVLYFGFHNFWWMVALTKKFQSCNDLYLIGFASIKSRIEYHLKILTQISLSDHMRFPYYPQCQVNELSWGAHKNCFFVFLKFHDSPEWSTQFSNQRKEFLDGSIFYVNAQRFLIVLIEPWMHRPAKDLWRLYQ
jgi:hypothetical protein